MFSIHVLKKVLWKNEIDTYLNQGVNVGVSYFDVFVFVLYCFFFLYSFLIDLFFRHLHKCKVFAMPCKMGRIRQSKRRKSMKEVWNIMTQFWNCLTQVWNWNLLLFKVIFRDEMELFLEWKWMKKVWKTLGKPILRIAHPVNYSYLPPCYKLICQAPWAV